MQMPCWIAQYVLNNVLCNPGAHTNGYSVCVNPFCVLENCDFQYVTLALCLHLFKFQIMPFSVKIKHLNVQEMLLLWWPVVRIWWSVMVGGSHCSGDDSNDCCGGSSTSFKVKSNKIGYIWKYTANFLYPFKPLNSSYFSSWYHFLRKKWWKINALWNRKPHKWDRL